jgi:hypothetical protein
MALSGTIPHFHHGLAPTFGSPTVVTVTGTDTGLSTGTHSTESLRAFYKRVQVALGGISGTQLVSGVTSGVTGVGITSGQLSGLRAIQREIAARAADISHSFQSNGPRLTEAQRFLSLSGGEIVGL